MKNFYKTIGLFSIMLFSFYYTEKIAIIMQNKNPIMQKINEIEDNYVVQATNAVIEGEYITPGISGQKVNKNKSFVNMKSFGSFHEYYLIFDDIKPDISLVDNKDKIIHKGNHNKKAVALLVDHNEQILKYLEENKIKASILVEEDTYKSNSYFEQINNDFNAYGNVESLLNKNNHNQNICYIKMMDIEECKKNEKYLVEESFSLSQTNIVEAKQSIFSGAIILIKPSARLDEFKLLVNEIKFKGLNFIYLSDLIAEKK